MNIILPLTKLKIINHYTDMKLANKTGIIINIDYF